MQMTTTTAGAPVPSSAYLLPDPNRSSAKTTLIKSVGPLATSYHPIAPLPRSSQTNVHLTVRSAAVPPVLDPSSTLTLNNCHSDDSSSTTVGSGGHSLSHSMESINNIGLNDEEVRPQ